MASYHVRCFKGKAIEARLRWFGNTQRVKGCWCWSCQAGGLKWDQREDFMDLVKQDMKLVGVIEDVAEHRIRWRQMIGFEGKSKKRSVNVPLSAIRPSLPCLLWFFSHDSLNTPILGWGRMACFHGRASRLPKAAVFAIGWLNIWMVSVPCWWGAPWSILGQRPGLLKVLRPLPMRST